METDQKTPGQVKRLDDAPWLLTLIDDYRLPAHVEKRLWEISAVLAHDRANQPAASGVPEGWKLVPVKPSEEMILATCGEIETYRDDFGSPFFMSYGEAKQAWDLMIAAAPEAPKP